MWQALAGAYEKLDKRSEALKAYKRALCCPEPFDTSIYERITAICESMGRTDLAKQYQRAAIEGAISAEWDFIDYAPQVLKLASLEMSSRDAHGRANGDLDLAERYLTKLANACPQGEVRFLLRLFSSS